MVDLEKEKEIRSFMNSFWLGRHPRTVRAYKDDFARLATWANSVSTEAFVSHFFSLGSGAAYRLAYEFKGQMMAKKWSPAYVNNHLSALRALVKFARRIERIEWSLDIENVPIEAFRDTKGPGFDGLVRIVNVAAQQEDKWRATRDTAIVMLMITMGLRCNEVVTLDLEHVDFRGKRIYVQAKRKLQRNWVTASKEMLASVKAWVTKRGSEPGPLFLSRAFGRQRPDGRLANSSTWKIVSDLATKAGLDSWPHALRHAAITTVLDLTDGNVCAAQAFARHSSPAETMRYDDTRKDLGGEMGAKISKALARARKRK